MSENPITQIYLITPPQLGDIAQFAKTLNSTLASAPIACVQLRLKATPSPDIIAAAKIILPICHARNTLLIINDNAQIAAQVGADGVHLGQGDDSVTNAKELLSKDAIIGVTCHNSKDLAFEAANSGADYVAFGSVFPSPTKPDAMRADLELIQWWNEATILPSVAIGGITVDNARLVIGAKADYIALSSGVWDYKDGPQDAVSKLQDLCVQYSAL